MPVCAITRQRFGPYLSCRYVPLFSTDQSYPAPKALFALVAHDESLDIGLLSKPAGAGGDPLRIVVEPTATADSQQRASEATPAQDPNQPEAALARLESLVTGSTLWPAAVDVWKRFHTSQTQPAMAAAATTAGGANSSDLTEHSGLDRHAEKVAGGEHVSQAAAGVDVTRLKFRCSVVRDGKHPFGSVEASPRLGGAVWSINPGWTVDLKVMIV